MTYLEEIIYLGKRLMAYESVYGHGGVTESAVFGKTILDCQKDVLDYCDSIGMNTYLDPEGMYGYAETGPGKEYIAILTHLDIVDAGDLNQWEKPPFSPEIIGDKLLGRGSADDKIPAAIAVLTVKKLLDEQYPLKYPIRLIFGSDEETGFRCIKKYKENHPPPKYTLVFDGTFPFSFSEKHLLNYELSFNEDNKVYGGENYNSVMDYVEWEKNDETIVMKGKSAHASRPHLGDNALVKLSYLHPDENTLFKLVQETVHPGGGHKLDFIEEAFREDVTLCYGKVRNDKLYLDMRVPPELSLEDFIQSFELTMSKYDVTLKRTDVMKGSITDIESEYAKTVLKCYQEISGDYTSQPFKTGSATYGRSFETNCLSFGPRMGYHITNTHKPNEFVTMDLIEKAFEIYVHTLKKIEEEL
jgi:acetylornithine deacetylase/succinyl-diaminopimelate desuccinylase-like protein